MRLSFFEWLGRVAALVLAMMVTLSLIGAFLALPTEDLLPPGNSDPDISEPAAWQPPAQDAVPEVAPEPREKAASPGDTALVQTPEQQAAADLEERWRKALTYGVMALAGLLALAMRILMRIAGELRRIADALERR
jgi:hypothetical protein